MGRERGLINFLPLKRWWEGGGGGYWTIYDTTFHPNGTPFTHPSRPSSFFFQDFGDDGESTYRGP